MKLRKAHCWSSHQAGPDQQLCCFLHSKSLTLTTLPVQISWTPWEGTKKRSGRKRLQKKPRGHRIHALSLRKPALLQPIWGRTSPAAIWTRTGQRNRTSSGDTALVRARSWVGGRPRQVARTSRRQRAFSWSRSPVCWEQRLRARGGRPQTDTRTEKLSDIQGITRCWTTDTEASSMLPGHWASANSNPMQKPKLLITFKANLNF